MTFHKILWVIKMNYDKYFPMKNDNLIYFDNAATTLKPISVINKEIEYMSLYSANSHRGDYNISFKVDDEIDNTRELTRKFINAKHKDEIIFTKNTTDSLNLVINGFFKNILKENDEVILNKAEHASNILPWLILKNEIGINSIRGGNIVGEHTVQFFGEYETFEIKHTSYSRNLFAEGALKAADFIVTKSNGLYNMEDMFK